jgi:hypothetical protein
MSYNILLLTRRRSRYDAVCTIDYLISDWSKGDPDANFYWQPFDRNDKLNREQLIEAAVQPATHLTEQVLAGADHVLAYDKAGKLAKFARGCPDFAPPIPPLEILRKRFEPTWIGSMCLRYFDCQSEESEPVNRYVFLNSGEKLFVMHKLLLPDTSFRYAVEQCAISPADDGLTVSRFRSIDQDEVKNLTSEGNSLLDGFEAVTEAQLGAPAEER